MCLSYAFLLKLKLQKIHSTHHYKIWTFLCKVKLIYTMIGCYRVCNTTFNNISLISYLSILLENH